MIVGKILKLYLMFMIYLDVFQIIMGIEDAFEIEIPTEEAETISTVGDAVEKIKNAIN